MKVECQLRRRLYYTETFSVQVIIATSNTESNCFISNAQNRFLTGIAETLSATSSNSNECNLQNLNDEGMSDGYSDQTNGESSAVHCSTASAPKDIKFNIHHKYTTHNVTVSDRSTIG